MTRLFPGRRVAVTQATCLTFVAVGAAMAWFQDGPARLGGQGLALAGLLLWVAAVRMTLLPRQQGPVPVRADGSVVVESPVAVVWLLLGAWAAMLCGVAALVVAAVVDPRSVESPGGMLVMVGGAVGSLPDLVRLLTGRLHRWRVVADDHGIRYRGYHTDQALAWSEVASMRVSVVKPVGVDVERRDGGPAVHLPAVAFDVHPTAIAQALEQRRATALRG